MLRLLKVYSQHRLAWFLLLLSAVSFELIALFFQHVMLLTPCVLCIYQRVVIFGILLSAVVALINPQRVWLRLIAIISWIALSVRGFLFAYEQVTLQFEPSIFHSCPLYVEFPRWLPLNKWLPSVFESYGNCADRIWQFLTLEMSQWTLIIFICYTLVGLLVLLSQLCKSTKK